MECEIAGDVVLGDGGFGDLLRIFCGNGAWDYAVFWKIRHQIPMFLSWEDGYCNHARSKLMPEYSLDASYFDGGTDMCSSIEDASRQSLGSIVAGMSSLCYYVREGLVGEVAGTGNYCWLSHDGLLNYINSETSSALFLCCSYHKNGWLNSRRVLREAFIMTIPATMCFKANGLGWHRCACKEWLENIYRTILLVPVLPHGVLQLGSLEMVTEDVEVVAHIAERFVSLLNVLGHSPIYLEPEDFQDLLLLPQMSCLAEDMDDSFSIIEKNLDGEVDLTEDVINFKEHSVTLEPLEENLSVSMDNDQNNRLLSLAEAHAFVECYPGGFCVKADDDCHSSDFIALAWADKVLSDIQDDILGNAFSFSMAWDFEEAFNSNASSWENEVCHLEDETEYPTPAEYDSTSNNGESSPVEVGNYDYSTSLAETALISPERKYKSKEISTHEREDSAEHSVVTTAFSTRPQDKPRDSPISSPAPQSAPNLADEKARIAKVDTNQSEQDKKQPTTGCKRKGRPGDNARSRPWDRQLIQDRVKELRELVPNGSKCSIDALLGQTVKHMLFLRSVTSRAEKLRKCTPPGESGWNRWTDLEVATKNQNGSNWALEIGDELQVCPIVMEDLEYPGLMLIEMMCNEQGMFLEIADVLRRLELNIVRGATEARRDNNWASFVVEASKGFHRVDIFWPLMQLLQRTRKNLSSST